MAALDAPAPARSRIGPAFHESVNLDFLRSVAVLLVFFSHYFELRGGSESHSVYFWRMGGVGVLFFFVHTCLVLMWSLERTNQTGAKIFAPFYMRRFFRIYPLSIVFVLFAFIFDARWLHPNLWPSLTLTQYFFKSGPNIPPSVSPLWSLPLEVEMYVMLPALFLFFRNRSIKLLGIAWIICLALGCIQLQLGEQFLILRYMPCFLGGVITWRLMRERDLKRLPAWLWPLAIAAIAPISLLAETEYQPACIAILGLVLGLAIPFFHEIRSARVAAVSKIIARYSYGIS
jgi:peptidoglycan/LPS O-acetylase OafA/YrhL